MHRLCVHLLFVRRINFRLELHENDNISFEETKKQSKIDWIISIQIRYRNSKGKDGSKDYLMPDGNKTWNRLQTDFDLGLDFD